MARLGLRTRDALYSLPDDDLLRWLAYDHHLQEAVETIMESLANPKSGKDSMLSPEAFALLMLGKL